MGIALLRRAYGRAGLASVRLVQVLANWAPPIGIVHLA
jgi:hypothetical protein